jgi:hypothetical protein
MPPKTITFKEEVADKVYRVIFNGKWVFDSNKLRLFNSKEQARNYRDEMVEKYDLAPSKTVVGEAIALDRVMEKALGFKEGHPGVQIVLTTLKENVIMSELVLMDGRQTPS